MLATARLGLVICTHFKICSVVVVHVLLLLHLLSLLLCLIFLQANFHSLLILYATFYYSPV